ncbi:hypothetical protein ABTK13_23775, partial [Acinetobacter baumannii]
MALARSPDGAHSIDVARVELVDEPALTGRRASVGSRGRTVRLRYTVPLAQAPRFPPPAALVPI